MASSREILDFLDRHQIHGGLAPRVLAPLLTFLSGERVVFAATSPKERYLPYEEYARGLGRAAFISMKEKEEEEWRAWYGEDLKTSRRAKESKQVGEYVVRLIEEPGRETGPADLPYAEWRPRPRLGLCLNE